MINAFISAVVAVAVSVGSFFGFYNPSAFDNHIRDLISEYVEDSKKNLGGDTILPIAGTTYNLSGSGISSSATSINLASLTLAQTGQELLDADFSSTFYVTLEPGNRTRQEIVSCTTVTQGAGTLATLSGCSRGLSPISPYTASTTLQFAHGGGTQVIFSNPPQLYNQFAAKDNDETISGVWDFTASPTGPVPTTSTQLTTKGYVDGGILAGAATSTETTTGISRLATKLQQASSTATTANTPYVLQAQNATSTYNAGTAGGSGRNVVVTQNNNTIDSNFIATSSVYNWTGSHSWTASTTFSNATTSLMATTSIAAATSTAPLYLNNNAFSFPSTRSASSTVWTNDGIGNVLMIQPEWGQIASTILTGATATTTLSFPARARLMIILEARNLSSTATFNVVFNSDTANNYGCRNEVGGGGATLFSDVGGMRLGSTINETATNQGMYATVFVSNTPAVVKFLNFQAVYQPNSGATAPMNVTGSCVWNNTSAAITSISIGTTNPASTMGAGSIITVYGSSN